MDHFARFCFSRVCVAASFLAAVSVSGGDHQQFSGAPISFNSEASAVDQTTAPGPNSVTVGVQVGQSGRTFTPSAVTILVGDTVQWTFVGSGHTVTSGPTCTVDNMYCSPSDTGCGTATTNAPNTTYSHTFNAAGTYPYFCRFHCNFQMKGTVEVILPAITSVTRALDGTVTVTGTSVPNRSATVRSAPDLMTAFGNPQPITTGANGVFQFDDASAAAATAQFYQVSFP